MYADPVFEEALPNMPTTLACVILAIVFVAAGCAAAYLMDIAGRRVRILLIILPGVFMVHVYGRRID